MTFSSGPPSVGRIEIIVDAFRRSALLYLPTNFSKPAPAIVALTPYEAQRSYPAAAYFASNGYPFVSVDARGRGDSEGEFDPLNEKQDGPKAVEWIARQPWCDGRTAMWGGSYLGFAQWATACGDTPSLASIAPTAAPRYGTDVPIRRNVATPYTIRWLASLSGRTFHERRFADEKGWKALFQAWFEDGCSFRSLGHAALDRASLFERWCMHPAQDGYWDRHNPVGQEYARVQIPVLTITGAYDGDQLGALSHYRMHIEHCDPITASMHHLIIGPWDHAGAHQPAAKFCGLDAGDNSVVDMNELHLKWYDWIFERGNKPAFLRDRVAYFVMGADRWRYARDLDQTTGGSLTLYPSSISNPTDVFASGTLSARQPAGGPDWYGYDPSEIGTAGLSPLPNFEDYADQSCVYERNGRQLIYHSAGFLKPTEVTGFVRFEAWLSIDQPCTDFLVSLFEIKLDGTSIYLTSDWMRARYREDIRQEELVSNSNPQLYDFDAFPFFSRLIASGSRIRLTVGPINSVHFEKNYNSGNTVAEETRADSRLVTVRLHHDAAHPTALVLPLGQENEID